MADNPQAYARAAARPVPYTTAIGRAMNMQAIVEGWLPEVIGWHCTVSDQFMLTADGALGGGAAAPAVMEFPITFDGVWVPQHGAGVYFAAPVARVYQPGSSQPAAQPVPAGYRARVNKVSVEVGWVNGGSVPVTLWDPGDYTRWSWMRKPVATPAVPTPQYSVLPGTKGFPCSSRTMYGLPSYFIGAPFDNVNASTTPAVKVGFTGGTGFPLAVGTMLLFAGGGYGVVESSYVTSGVAPNQAGSIILRAGTVNNTLGLTGAITSSGAAAVATSAGLGSLQVVEVPSTAALSYQQVYHYPQAIMPPIFLEPGEYSKLRVENFTSDATQQVALSMSVSGVMWPIGLEGS